MKKVTSVFFVGLLLVCTVLWAQQSQQRNFEEDFERWFAYLSNNNRNRAIAECTQAIQVDPNNGGAYFFLGYLYSEYTPHDYDRAIANYTQAIRCNPNWANAYYFRGMIYLEEFKSYDRAIADLTQTIRLDPNSVRAYYLRGNAYEKKGDLNRAIADYETALRIDPNGPLASSVRDSLEDARQKRGRR